jgi:hypothetical protein
MADEITTRYAAIGLRVMHGAKAICTAVSNTMAKRIAAALNKHTPDRRGI